MADDDPEIASVGDMGQRLGLLGREDQTTRLSADKYCVAVKGVMNAMTLPLPLRHSHQGSQFTATDGIKVLASPEIKISMPSR